MTDDDRDLAEWVARWAGYEFRECDSCCPFGDRPLKCWLLHDNSHAPIGYPNAVLEDEARAWRAWEGLLSHSDDAECAARAVMAVMFARGCNLKEATFRALRAAKEG